MEPLHPLFFCRPFPRSLQWYWEQLVDKVPFRSVYEDAPGAQQPLIWGRSRNLSQTPREQCELQGLVREGLERGGPGQVGSVWGVVASAVLAGSVTAVPGGRCLDGKLS